MLRFQLVMNTLSNSAIVVEQITCVNLASIFFRSNRTVRNLIDSQDSLRRDTEAGPSPTAHTRSNNSIDLNQFFRPYLWFVFFHEQSSVGRYEPASGIIEVERFEINSTASTFSTPCFPQCITL